MDSTNLALINDIFTGVYVLLTLILAGAAIWSIRVSGKQSREALATSRLQSQAAIDAVHKQIEVSEKQSKESLTLLREQIEANKEQAKEALYNQFKPIIIPRGQPISKNATDHRVHLQNKGTGVASHVWGAYTSAWKYVISCTDRAYILGPDSEELVSFNTAGEVLYPHSEFEGYSVLAQSNGNSNFSPENRLMLTYSDTFNNNYLVFFDYNEKLGWRQWTEPKRIEKRLDQLAVKRGFLLPHQLGDE